MFPSNHYGNSSTHKQVAPVDSPHFKLTYSQIEGVYNNKLEYTPSVIEFIKLEKKMSHVFLTDILSILKNNTYSVQRLLQVFVINYMDIILFVIILI